jgi:hypothetical protein
VKQLTVFLEFLWKNLNTAADSLAQSAQLLPAAGLKDVHIGTLSGPFMVTWTFHEESIKTSLISKTISKWCTPQTLSSQPLGFMGFFMVSKLFTHL